MGFEIIRFEISEHVPTSAHILLQVVLANGKIVNANARSHPDLYFALRGGGNNFGIVTRFGMPTSPNYHNQS